MRWRAHAILGAGAGLAAAYFFGFSFFDALIACAASAISALLPDLDLRKSKASKVLGALALVAAVAAAVIFSGGSLLRGLMVFGALLALLLALDWFLRPKHRTVTHTGAAALAFSAACFFIFGWKIALACAIGYISHLAADKI